MKPTTHTLPRTYLYAEQQCYQGVSRKAESQVPRFTLAATKRLLGGGCLMASLSCLAMPAQRPSSNQTRVHSK